MSAGDAGAPVEDAAPATDVVVRFSGEVCCERRAGALPLVLIGAIDHGQSAHLAFASRVPTDLPQRLDAATVQRVGPDRYRLESGTRQWLLSASAIFLHLDAGKAFFRAIPPRRASLARRLLWHALVLLAASAPGRRWLEHRSTL